MGWEENREQYESQEHKGDSFRKFSDEPLISNVDFLHRVRTSKGAEKRSPFVLILIVCVLLILLFTYKPADSNATVSTATVIVIVLAVISALVLYVGHRRRSESKSAAEEIMAKYGKDGKDE